MDTCTSKQQNRPSFGSRTAVHLNGHSTDRPSTVAWMSYSAANMINEPCRNACSTRKSLSALSVSASIRFHHRPELLAPHKALISAGREPDDVGAKHEYHRFEVPPGERLIKVAKEAENFRFELGIVLHRHVVVHP